MKTGGDFLKVDPTPVAADGSKLEPEERAATEAIPLPIDVDLNDRATRPDEKKNVAGSMPGIVGIERTAGEVAQDTATRCELCVHWRHDDWLRHLAAIEDTRDGIAQINALRGELLGRAVLDGSDLTPKRNLTDLPISEEDFIAVNITIKREFGICAAFTESTQMVSATPYYGGCPEGESYFKMRDREARAIATAGYDKILRMAQGRNE